jgi:hypothetical protein
MWRLQERALDLVAMADNTRPADVIPPPCGG